MNRESLVNGTGVYCTDSYRFGQDALLLAHFSRVRTREAAADFGTGCGVIALWWHDRGHKGPCLAVDLQAEGLALLEHALSENQDAKSHIHPLCADLRRFPRDAWAEQSLDVIACNPPYFSGGYISPNPARAAARHELTCTTADVCRAAYPLLKDGGRLCLCQRTERMAEVLCAMSAARIEPKRLQMVAARAGKAPWLFLVEGQKNRAPSLRVLPELVTQTENLRPSPQILHIYGQTPKGEKT